MFVVPFWKWCFSLRAIAMCGLLEQPNCATIYDITISCSIIMTIMTENTKHENPQLFKSSRVRELAPENKCIHVKNLFSFLMMFCKKIFDPNPRESSYLSRNFLLHTSSSADHSKHQTSWINFIFLSELEHSSADKVTDYQSLQHSQVLQSLLNCLLWFASSWEWNTGKIWIL